MVYGLLRALPGDQACLTPSPARLLADLTPALGRQNDTTWPYASRPRSSRALPTSTASRPALMTCATPLSWDGTGIDIEVIWVCWQAKFLNFRSRWGRCFRGPVGEESALPLLLNRLSLPQPVGWWSAAIPITSRVTVLACRMPDYHRNFTAGCGFF